MGVFPFQGRPGLIFLERDSRESWITAVGGARHFRTVLPPWSAWREWGEESGKDNLCNILFIDIYSSLGYNRKKED